MHIIPQDPAGPFVLIEHGPTGTRTIDTAMGRAAGLDKFDQRLREHPVRYRGWTGFRLVLKGGAAL